MAKRALRNRNGGKWTEAKYWSVVRSSLRRSFRFWYPGQLAKQAALIPNSKPKMYKCAMCKKAFREKEIQIDHKVPCGTLKSYEDIPVFLKRLTPEDPKAFQVLCKECHRKKTKSHDSRKRKIL
jgi:Zn finger protein HypA/HybF involved in hydrogenase expression